MKYRNSFLFGFLLVLFNTPVEAQKEDRTAQDTIKNFFGSVMIFIDRQWTKLIRYDLSSFVT